MIDRTSTCGAEVIREIVIGRNSKVWKASARNPDVVRRFSVALSHSDVGNFNFGRGDRVWIFAYSKEADGNSRLLSRLEAAGVQNVVYVSTATTNVTRLTNCYAYPRVKQQAELEARRRFNAKILRLGLVVGALSEVPAGWHAVTFQERLDRFLLEPQWGSEDNDVHLFEFIAVPFARGWERLIYRLYDSIQWALRRYPCVLRPFDFFLRAIGIRWYGYVNLSNRLWSTTTSSSVRG